MLGFEARLIEQSTVKLQSRAFFPLCGADMMAGGDNQSEPNSTFGAGNGSGTGVG